ncbi:conserved oligomeric Golgi complex subunit 7 isoform X2 [Leptidea sinapis]|uniref:conserved oligomeric Golgi complex subunit 7 isoform X2 n=1 Tax=Leptidea sinapis TaxID=189913 RepID=UPI0021C49C48|nr:conserved oligomeric Golgi complex subunit 7 isoform X2 [Leptidea sinapis]
MKMDLKTFASDDFDPKQWINKAWSLSGNQEKEIFVANAVTRLQLYMKQLNNSLDETTTQIMSSMPRVVQEMHRLQVQGGALQHQLENLERHVLSVEQQTGHSIESLQRIDVLKSRLENAVSALREGDKWAALASALEEVLEGGAPTQKDDLLELAEQIEAMTASLEVLSESPDFAKKRTQLELLYNRIEAAIRPAFIDSFTQLNADLASVYVRIMAAMSRSGGVARVWRQATVTTQLAHWRRDPALPALSSLTMAAPTHMEWLTNVVRSETAVAELLRLYTDVLLSLDPSLTKTVTAEFKLCQSPEEVLVMLADLRTGIDDFVQSIVRIIDTHATGGVQKMKQMSEVREVGRAIFSPLRALLPEYGRAQTQLLLAQLDDQALRQEDLLESCRAILSTAERSEGWLTQAYARGRQIAGTAVLPFYLPAVDSYVSAVLNVITSQTRTIEASFLSAVAKRESVGVLSEWFPGTLLLDSAAALMLQWLTDAYKHTEDSDDHPIFDLSALLLDQESRDKVNKVSPQIAGLRRASDHLRKLARNILRNPVDVQLDKIAALSAWSNNDALSTDLPDFALSPQEYITEIGQYLMTLPQHLEMHLSEKQAPWQFLAEVCSHTCDAYAQRILKIRDMDALGTRRCLTDIVYLSSVVEDLGTATTPALRNLEKSLRAAAGTQPE